MRGLITKILISTLAIWISDFLFAGVKVAEGIENLFLVGVLLGLLLFFVKPILDLITLPLRLLTLGFFSILITMFLIFVVDVITLDKFEARGIIGLLETALVIWSLNIILPFFFRLIPKRKAKLVDQNKSSTAISY